MSTVVPVVPTIALTPNEAKLVQLLTDCADWVDQHPEEVDALRLKDDQGRWIGRERGTEAVELRVAGGWVRDKVRSPFFSSGWHSQHAWYCRTPSPA